MHTLVVSYTGFSEETDQKISSIVASNRNALGGGYGNGKRDLAWTFRERQKAILVAHKVVDAGTSVRGLDVRVYDDKDSDNYIVIQKKKLRV